MSLEIIIVNTIEFHFIPDSCMDVALVSGEGAVTMLYVVIKSTSVCAIESDLCSLAVSVAIFELSDVVEFSTDESAESVQLPIHE